MVVFGEGYAVTRVQPLHWLSEKHLVYWGDIDTHGFAILGRLRQTHGHAQSMLMDRATLLAHESQWVREPNPTTEHLDTLLPAEARLYAELVDDTFGAAVRLEQERISFAAIEQALRQHAPVTDG